MCIRDRFSVSVLVWVVPKKKARNMTALNEKKAPNTRPVSYTHLYREEFGKEGGRNGGLAEFRLKKRTGFTGSKWCVGY